MFTPIPPYVPGYPATPNITPFTFRDGLTYLLRLELLTVYINKTLIEEVDEAYQMLAQAFSAAVNSLIEEVNTKLAEQDAQLSDFDTRITTLETEWANFQASLDPNVAALINDSGSDVRSALDALYVSEAELDGDVTALVNSGASALRAALNTIFVNEADLNTAVAALVNAAGATQTALDTRYVQESELTSKVTGPGAIQTANDARYVQETELDPDTAVLINTAGSDVRAALDGLFQASQGIQNTPWINGNDETLLAAGYTLAGAGLQYKIVNGIAFVQLSITAAAAAYTVQTNGAISPNDLMIYGLPVDILPDILLTNGNFAAPKFFTALGNFLLSIDGFGKIYLVSAPIDSTWTAATPNALGTIGGTLIYPVYGADVYSQNFEGITDTDGWVTYNANGVVSFDDNNNFEGDNSVEINPAAIGDVVGIKKTISGLTIGGVYRLRGWFSVGSSYDMVDLKAGVTGIGVGTPIDMTGNTYGYPEFEFEATAESHECYFTYNAAADASASNFDVITVKRIG